MSTKTADQTDDVLDGAGAIVFAATTTLTLLFFSGVGAGAAYVRLGEPYSAFHMPTWGLVAIGALYLVLGVGMTSVTARFCSENPEVLSSE